MENRFGALFDRGLKNLHKAIEARKIGDSPGKKTAESTDSNK